MAKIGRFESIAPGNDQIHSDVDCGYKIFDLDGKRILQLDTYGSAERKIKGKVSQSIQFDEEAAAYLAGVLRRAFPRLKI